MTARIDHVETSGTFNLDGGSWDVDNNVWIVGDDTSVVVIDPAHDVEAVVQTVGNRKVEKILLTHGHDDHISEAVEAARALQAPLYFPPADRMLWDAVHSTAPDEPIQDGDTFHVAGVGLQAMSTPGHSPGSTCFYSEDLGVVFSGDTLFNGGPGATGRSYSSYETILESIEHRLFPLPESTRVLTGHGPETTIGSEKPHLQEWKDSLE